MRTRRLAIVSYVHQSFGAELLRGIMAYQRSVVDEKWCVDLVIATMDKLALVTQSFDGIIAPLYTAEQADFLVSLNSSVVNVTDSYFSQDIPLVTFDNDKIGRLAAEHLLECNVQKFIYLGKKGLTYCDTRFHSFLKLLQQHGKSAERLEYKAENVDFHFGEINYDLTFLADLLMKRQTPLGIFAESDVMALGVVKAATRLGLQFPRDIALVSVNDDPLYCESAEVKISSIKTSAFEVGFKAAETLHKLMISKECQMKTLISPQGIIIRESSDIVSLKDEIVAQALRFIRGNVSEGINVNDVAETVPVSRRTLEIRFNKCLGRGILQTIMDERLCLAKSLLENTNKGTKRIAYESGFSSVQRMSACFKQNLGVTPSEYRKTV